ncbi:hypothetical protein APR09_001789 [Nocardia amikacinitolerans]|nr:hypothetical protein [Nocardia amikacinitolerans]
MRPRSTIAQHRPLENDVGHRRDGRTDVTCASVTDAVARGPPQGSEGPPEFPADRVKEAFKYIMLNHDHGGVKLDELVTTRYSLDDITKGFADMNAGRNLRGVVVYD